LGIPAVIATSAPISDTRAKDLAIRFYQHIALGESIPQAYESAVRFLNSGELSQDRKIPEAPLSLRGIMLENREDRKFPWGLYIKEGAVLQGSPLALKLPAGEKEGPAGKTIVQHAEKIYNIENIDKADFS
jgi:hypothetical protein